VEVEGAVGGLLEAVAVGVPGLYFEAYRTSGGGEFRIAGVGGVLAVAVSFQCCCRWIATACRSNSWAESACASWPEVWLDPRVKANLDVQAGQISVC